MENPTRPYPEDTESLVTVTYTDGEVVVYPISAGPGVTRYLAREMGNTGSLTLFTKSSSVTIPSDQIRNYEIVKYERTKPAFDAPEPPTLQPQEPAK